MMKLYWSPRNPRRHRDLDDGGSRPALRARADRYLHGRAEEAGVSGDQSHGQGPGPAGRRRDDGAKQLRSAPTSPTATRRRSWRRRSATQRAQNIFTGCSLRRAASSPRSCRSSPSWRCLPAPQAGATPTQVFDVLDKALEKGPWLLGDDFRACDVVIGFGPELCDPPVQDGAGAPVVRPLSRSLRRTPRVPARAADCERLRTQSSSRLSGLSTAASASSIRFSASARGIEMML